MANRTWVRPLQARDTDEDHRVSTPLELFFDLCFVVAVAQAAGSLHHALVEGHVAQALVGYPTVFFAIWWAWMNYTWFSSAYDNDDVPYRLATFVEIIGVLILAAGVPRAFADQDSTIIFVGYAVMRLALISLWLRAAHADPERRPTDVRYAVGIGVCMVGWACLLVIPHELWLPSVILVGAAELLVPLWAERPSGTTWHPHHIAERYGLFTLIVLGESVLAATTAIQSGIDNGETTWRFAGVVIGGVLIVFSMWWVYFAQPAAEVVTSARAAFGVSHSGQSFVWGYGHFFVFSSAAAVGAGLEVAIDQAAHPIDLSTRGATAAVAAPVSLYLLSVWLLHLDRRRRPWKLVLTPVAAALIVLVAVLDLPVVLIGVIAGLLVAVSVSLDHRPIDLTEWPDGSPEPSDLRG